MFNKKNNNLKRSKTRFEGIDLNTLGQSYNFNNHSMKRSQSEFFEEINKSNNYESPNKYQKENIINQANDLPIINETIEKTDQFCTILKKRISGLKNIFFKTSSSVAPLKGGLPVNKIYIIIPQLHISHFSV